MEAADWVPTKRFFRKLQQFCHKGQYNVTKFATSGCTVHFSAIQPQKMFREVICKYVNMKAMQFQAHTLVERQAHMWRLINSKLCAMLYLTNE